MYCYVYFIAAKTCDIHISFILTIGVVGSQGRCCSQDAAASDEVFTMEICCSLLLHIEAAANGF